jgi:hypothetical protein
MEYRRQERRQIMSDQAITDLVDPRYKESINTQQREALENAYLYANLDMTVLLKGMRKFMDHLNESITISAQGSLKEIFGYHEVDHEAEDGFMMDLEWYDAHFPNKFKMIHFVEVFWALKGIEVNTAKKQRQKNIACAANARPKRAMGWPPKGSRVGDSFEYKIHVVERGGEWHEAKEGEGETITGTFMLLSHLPRQFGCYCEDEKCPLARPLLLESTNTEVHLKQHLVKEHAASLLSHPAELKRRLAYQKRRRKNPKVVSAPAAPFSAPAAAPFSAPAAASFSAPAAPSFSAPAAPSCDTSARNRGCMPTGRTPPRNNRIGTLHQDGRMLSGTEVAARAAIAQAGRRLLMSAFIIM